MLGEHESLFQGLLREVAQQADHNLMNSHNLAVVISPNLLRGPNPMTDVEMCSISPKKTTLASVVKLCVDEYADIFE